MSPSCRHHCDRDQCPLCHPELRGRGNARRVPAVLAALVAAVLLLTGCLSGRPVNCSFMTPAQRQEVRDRGDYCRSTYRPARKPAKPWRAPARKGGKR